MKQKNFEEFTLDYVEYNRLRCKDCKHDWSFKHKYIDEKDNGIKYCLKIYICPKCEAWGIKYIENEILID